MKISEPPPDHCMQLKPKPVASSLHTQICRLSGARLILAVRRSNGVPR